MKFKIQDGTLLFAINIDKERKMVVPEGVITIAEGACANDQNIEEIEFPKSLQFIKSRAFSGCSNLKELSIPENVKGVEPRAFEKCSSLQTLNWHPNTIFLEHVFSGCRKLNKIAVPGSSARVFYFPVEDRFAVANFNCVFPGGEIKVYRGNFAADVFPTIAPPEGADVYYFTVLEKDGREFFWYDRDLERAVNGVVYASREETIEEHFKGPITPDTIISPEDFGLMTGICSDGIETWIKSMGKDWSWRAPVKEILDGLHRDIPGAYRRFLYVLLRQNEKHDHSVNASLSLEEAFRRDDE